MMMNLHPTWALRCITDDSGYRTLIDSGGVRILTEEEPGMWTIAITSADWAAWCNIAQQITHFPIESITSDGGYAVYDADPDPGEVMR